MKIGIPYFHSFVVLYIHFETFRIETFTPLFFRISIDMQSTLILLLLVSVSAIYIATNTNSNSLALALD